MHKTSRRHLISEPRIISIRHLLQLVIIYLFRKYYFIIMTGWGRTSCKFFATQTVPAKHFFKTISYWIKIQCPLHLDPSFCFFYLWEFLPQNIHWKDWCWSWNSNTLATWCEELTHLKRSWCCKRLKAGGEGDDRGRDDWMASPTQWTWVWVNSRSWWRTGRPGVLQSMGLQRVGHKWATELNRTSEKVWDNCLSFS